MRPTSVAGLRIEVDADQKFTNKDGDSFEGAFIREDGTRIPGTFTCDADDCTPFPEAITDITEVLLGITLLTAEVKLMDGWEFVSDNNVPEGETADANYMYFGYWLKSPVGDGTTDVYAFRTYSGGNGEMMNEFDETNRTVFVTDVGDAILTAKYEGGAAGMYVSRELLLVGGLVDEFSRGSSGRFTAKAELIAQFGPHPESGEMDATVTEENTLRGTISEFMDGDLDLGFEVTLEQSPITPMDGTAMGRTEAKFGDSGPGTGSWTAQLYGPAVDSESTERQKSATATGVAGTFDAVTTNTTTGTDDDAYSYHSRVVGAFAAEKK